MRIFINENVRQYKANLHCHTVNSDGSLTPEEIKREYMRRGYSAVAFTDHEHVIDNSHLTDDRFVAITSCELAVKEIPTGSTLTHPNMKATHLCLYSLDPHNTVTPCYNSVCDHFITPSVQGKIKSAGEYERAYGARGLNDIVRICHEQGFLVCYNHPSWSLESAADYLGYEGLDFIEILNTGSIIRGLYDDEAAFAEMLRAGKNIFCAAADDNHNRAPLESPGSDSFGSFVMISAKSLTYSELLASLSRGDFYASEGPEIYSLTEEDGRLAVRCSPAAQISLISIGRRARSELADSALITEASFDLARFPEGFRLRIKDERGKCAYTQFFRP